MKQQQSGFDADMGYMKPRKVGGGNGTFTLDDMKNEDQGPIWSAHYDEESREIYYFNRKTNDS
jgi:putative alpha-1,2-mannosidase